MASRLPDLTAYHVLRSRNGHDAFLTEPEQLSRLLFTTLAD
jgi:homoserine acetyltransferase